MKFLYQMALPFTLMFLANTCLEAANAPQVPCQPRNFPLKARLGIISVQEKAN